METILRGIGVSPGIAIGPVLAFDVDRYDIPHYEVKDTAAELLRLNDAIEATREDLTSLYKKTASQLGKKHADIFNAHLMLLDDVVMREEVAARLEEDHVNVEYILDGLAHKYAKVVGALDDPRFQERTADLLDVVDRILRRLLATERPDLKELPKPSVIVAHELSPSDTATMDIGHTLGIVLDSGSVTSHTAILARAIEVPAVMGADDVTTAAESDVTMIVDGTEGLVILDPKPATVKRYRATKRRIERERAKLLESVSSGPCTTVDGFEIPLEANIELPIEIDHSLKAGAQGIGLYRTEYLFLNRTSLPSEQEQYDAYTAAAKTFAPHPVTLRTMDIGGDKFVAHLEISKEDNPQLGWRAVRFCLERPDIFRVQLRAMLRASVHGKIRIMFPMISGVEELRNVFSVLVEVRAELRREGTPYADDVEVGSMIEVPSAVALADLLAKECHFFSIGTNDLIQYSLAVDRVNEKIAHLYEPAHPAVVRMISATANAARAKGIPCGICGEMAGDPLYTEMLLGLGVTSLSMSSLALPVIRALVSQVSMVEARELARTVLDMPTAGAIRHLLRERFEEKSAVQAYPSLMHPELEGAGPPIE